MGLPTYHRDNKTGPFLIAGLAESGNHMTNKRALWPWAAHLRMADHWSGTICAILVKGIMRNDSVKLF